MRTLLHVKMEEARREGRRLVVPLLGFPGLTLTGATIKLAQQNVGEHFKVVKALAGAFEPDALFPLMDLSVEANALGRYTVFPRDDAPTVVRDAFTMDDLAAARRLDVTFDTRLQGYVETVRLMNLGLPGGVLRGAYVTGPYTLAALLLGADEAAVATVDRPDELAEVCQFATEVLRRYARLLIAAGAQLLCVLEPSAVMLGPRPFRAFSSRFVRQLSDPCHSAGVALVYHTCGNTMRLVEAMAEAGVDALSLDSPAAGVDLPRVARTLGPEVALIGNVNPTGAILRGTPEEVAAEVTRLLEEMAPYPGFVLSTGCDLPQDTPLENIHAFMRAGRAPAA